MRNSPLKTVTAPRLAEAMHAGRKALLARWPSWRNRLMYLARSLLNATLLLAILLVLLGIVLVGKVERFTADVITDVKFGLLKEIDSDIEDVARSIRQTGTDLRLVSHRLQAIIEKPDITLSPEIRRDARTLTAELGALNRNISQFKDAHITLSDKAVRSIAAAMTDAYIAIRHCRPASNLRPSPGS